MIQSKDMEVYQEYTQIILNDSNLERRIIRIFECDVDKELMVWHTDESDRSIQVLNRPRGWKFQLDDDRPFDLRFESKFLIPEGYPHRLIRMDDSSKLVVLIVETKEDPEIIGI